MLRSRVFKEIEFRVISLWRGNFEVFLVAQKSQYMYSASLETQ